MLRTQRTEKLYHKFLKPYHKDRSKLDAFAFELALNGFISLHQGDRFSESPKLTNMAHKDDLWRIVREI